MATQRKIDFGPVQPIVTNIGDLYVHYFDHRYYVENETNHFIREFESKRGDHDINSLRDAHWLQVDSSQKLQEMTEQGEQLNEVLTKVKQLNSTLQTQLSKEEQFKTSRKAKRDEQLVKEDQSMLDIAKKQEQMKNEIDTHLNLEKTHLEQEYKRNWGWQKEIDLSAEYAECSIAFQLDSWKLVYTTMVRTYLNKSHFYHGKLTREQAEERLKNQTKGTFLIRDSSHQGHFVISRVGITGEIMHQLVIKIMKFKGFFIETENAIYSTLSELVRCRRKILKPNSAFPKPKAFGLLDKVDPFAHVTDLIEQLKAGNVTHDQAVSKGLLHKLCKYGLNSAFSKLFESDAKFLVKSVNAYYNGKTPLHYLAQGASLALKIEPYLEIAQILRKNGADFNRKDAKGCAPIHYLITDECISYRMVSYFVESGALIDGSEGANEEGFNALGLAVYQGPSSVIKYLLETARIKNAGSYIGNVITKDVNFVASGGHENINIVKQVLTCCPETDTNVVNRYGTTPLHAAVSFDQDWTNLAQFGKPMKTAKGYAYEIVDFLLAKHEANPNLTDENGKTPLHIACENGHRTSTICLLSRGADVRIKDKNGRYAEDYCRNRLVSPSSAVQWHLQALNERIHGGYTVLKVETLTKRIETHYGEILKELKKYQDIAAQQRIIEK